METIKGVSSVVAVAIIAGLIVIGSIIYFNMQPKEEIMRAEAEAMMEEGEEMMEEGEEMMKEGEAMMEDLDAFLRGEEDDSDVEEAMEEASEEVSGDPNRPFPEGQPDLVF